MHYGWIVGLTLLAVFVGAALPVLVQLFSTLRAARELIWRLGPKLDATLDDVRESAKRLKRTSGELEGGVREARQLFETAGRLAVAARQLERSVRVAAAVGNAVGPAVAAAVKAFAESRAPQHHDDDEHSPETETSDRADGAAVEGAIP